MFTNNLQSKFCTWFFWHFEVLNLAFIKKTFLSKLSVNLKSSQFFETNWCLEVNMVVWLFACPGYRWLWPRQGHEAEGESIWGSGHDVRATNSPAVASGERRLGPILNLRHRWPLDTRRIRRPQLWAGAIHNLPCEGHRESQRWRRRGYGDWFDALQPSVSRSCKKCRSQQQLWDQRGRLRKGGRWRLGNEIRWNCCGARLPWSIHWKWDVGGDQALHCNEQVLNPKP